MADESLQALMAGHIAVLQRVQDALQQQTLKRLQALVPADCPLLVHRDLAAQAFVVTTRDDTARPLCVGRFQVVAAFLDGYVRGWQLQASTYRPDHNGECLNCDEPMSEHAGPWLACRTREPDGD